MKPAANNRTPALLAAVAGLLCCGAALAEHYTVPLFVTSTESGAATGLVRIVNGTEESGTVEIHAIDDAGARTGPATFTLNASAAAEFTAADLAAGNAALGLTGGIGTVTGDARLEIETDLQIVPLAYVRAPDGTLSAMHDTVRAGTASGGTHRYLVPAFNLSTEMVHISRLRLINPGAAAAAVTIVGRDDSGTAAGGGEVTLTLAAGGARTLTAQQLEAGDTGITGRLGAGTGRWRLLVSSDRPLAVVNVVASTAGYWNNLSTTAVPGAAPADRESLNGRFAGRSVVLDTGQRTFTLTAMDGDRFTETAESDGVASTRRGGYGYVSIGPDAGRWIIAYDDGPACAAHLYFTSLASGWFASHCTDSENPDGHWIGGSWIIEGDGDADDDAETTYEVNDALPGVPTSGPFTPAVTSGGSVTTTAEGTTIALNEGGYIELNDGTRYTCTAANGCTIANGAVTTGTITGRSSGTGELDRFPTFRTAAAPGNQAYTVGTAIDALTLPEASGGNGALTYSLSPTVPGLTFSAATRRLTGTPTAAGVHAMSYTVRDEDGDTDTLAFTVTVNAATSTEGSLGVCQVGMTLSSGQSCSYPDTAEEFSVNARGRGSFLSRLAGIRIRINNQTIDGQVYDFEATHQGDGVWRIERIAGSTEPQITGDMGTGDTDTSPSFAADASPGNQTYTVGAAIETLILPGASGGNGALTYSLTPDVPGLTFDAATRQLTGTPSTAASYDLAYTATDEDGDTETLRFTITVNSESSTGMDETPLPPLSVADEFPDSRLVTVYNDNVIVMRVDEDVSTRQTVDSMAAYSNDFYSWFEDEFDYLVFHSNLTRDQWQDSGFSWIGRYRSVMNDTEGLGRSIHFDSAYGSAGRLRGVILILVHDQGPWLHELMHAWANRAVPTTNRSHWGFSSANGHLGGFDIDTLLDLGSGRWSARGAGGLDPFGTGGKFGAGPYSPIELYFAGLALPEEVPDLWVAEDGAWEQDANSGVFTAHNVRTWSIEDIVALNGARNPSSADVSRGQRAAVILLTDASHPPTTAVVQAMSERATRFGLQGDDGEPDHFNYYEATLGRATLTLDGLSEFRKSVAEEPANLPSSFGIPPPPHMTTLEELCGPFVSNVFAQGLPHAPEKDRATGLDPFCTEFGGIHGPTH